MNSSKIRERKCSTCKHYQPSPLWRKGWCRNPLLYDRNTNHLVEADSLACNRTFIDYWEPITGPSPNAGTAGRAARPRIAPSIPMEMTDARGQRVTHTGITPMGGMSAVTDDEVEAALASDDLPYEEAVDKDYALPDGGQSTTELPLVEGISPNGAATGPVAALTRAGERGGAKSATSKTRVVRQPQRPIIFGMGRDRLILIGVTAIMVLIALATGAMLLSQPGKVNQGVPATATVAPLPSPTGFGDPTATAPPAPTVTTAPPPPTDVIAVGGYVETTANVTLRSEATTAGARLGVLQSGTKAHVLEGPKQANNYNWWKVDGYDSGNPQASGWVAGEFLRPIAPP
ncbi:MAG: SH3 domain-containing protein [Chloroflexia bacterium]